MTRTVALHLKSRGIRSMIVWVLSDNLPPAAPTKPWGKLDKEQLENLAGVQLQ